MEYLGDRHVYAERIIDRKSWLFAESVRGAKRAALMYTLIGAAKLNGVDPQTSFADVLARIAEQTHLGRFLPWNSRDHRITSKAA